MPAPAIGTALLVFPAGDPSADAAAEACASCGWNAERATQPALALLRLIRPAAGLPAIGLLIAAAGLGGLGAAGLAKAARSRPGSTDLPLLVVGELPLDLPRSRCVAPRSTALAEAIAAVMAPVPATAQPADPDLVDAGVVAMLRELPGLWDRALSSFANDLPGHLGDLDAALAAGDLAALHRGAHALKGASGSIGARALHAALTRLDRAAAEGDAAGAAALLPAVRPLAQRSLAALRSR